jgi:predicted NAD/FAD-dependent oxidoreductase
MTKMLPCWAVMAVFNSIIPVNYDAAFVNDSPLSWICRNNSKPGRPDIETWILHASAKWSQTHIEDAPDTVSEILMQEFRRITRFSDEQLQYKNAHRWRFAQCDIHYGQASVWEQDNGLGICGDWFGESKIEGAFLSGYDLASKIINKSS